MNELVLDRRIESNTLPFLVNGFASWSTLFIFETTQIIPVVARHILRSRSFDPQTRQIMLLIFNTSLAISRTKDYSLPQFTTLQRQIDRSPARDPSPRRYGVTRELALATMEHSHQFISMLFKVGSFASVLSVMDLYAPVFRRACPECSEGLVNLRRCLTTLDVQLKYYASLDDLLSLITHRPMFLRYTLDFLSPQEEPIMKSNKGTGLRWMYGVPDQLMFTLAKMNGLFEDFGNRVDPETIQELEQEIAACRPVVSIGSGEDPIMNLGRIMVQEAWTMAARVYLYMGLCGANSLDVREVKVWNVFMRRLGGVKSRRHPDSFLVYPIAIPQLVP
ncbi:fungal zn(2)-cys(6) binuclear cluster domain protein, putative [Rhizoctonia solani AG-3 Rhs1AP]|uniref:Fungal zn(2)-cys(6) binuclear cluster domain protein, putative n=1 Tax=Rhizoctonia solani AG-3 Rhs1AP TaxID=1086054 RepID=X8IYP1_9AGAM|nr:fungal zn(2)-cys(6) binuclear cluster domain protein, putative [Rhizoctonia solani AG-3 Rhs1AP]